MSDIDPSPYSELPPLNVCKKPRLLKPDEAHPSAVTSMNRINSDPTKQSDIPKLDPIQTKPRCIVCKKKLGLLPFKCKCGVVTCTIHKWPEHKCSFDYQAEERERLSKKMVVIKAEKVQAI